MAKALETVVSLIGWGIIGSVGLLAMGLVFTSIDNYERSGRRAAEAERQVAQQCRAYGFVYSQGHCRAAEPVWPQ